MNEFSNIDGGKRDLPASQQVVSPAAYPSSDAAVVSFREMMRTPAGEREGETSVPFSIPAELMAGGAPMSPSVARKVTQYFQKAQSSAAQMEKLTDRERDILHHISQGHGDKQIGDRLQISVNTVRNHVASIYSKLQVHSRTAAAVKYLGS